MSGPVNVFEGERQRGGQRRRPHRPGTGLLAVGLVSAAALIGYIAYAFAVNHPHKVQATLQAQVFKSGIATWRPINAKISRIHGGAKMGAAMQAVPASLVVYAVQIPTISVNPLPGERVRISLWLKAASSPRLEILVDKFRAGAPNRYLIARTVSVGHAWRHLSMTRRVRGRWLGLGIEISSHSVSLDSSFAVRGLMVAMF